MFGFFFPSFFIAETQTVLSQVALQRVRRSGRRGFGASPKRHTVTTRLPNKPGRSLLPCGRNGRGPAVWTLRLAPLSEIHSGSRRDLALPTASLLTPLSPPHTRPWWHFSSRSELLIHTKASLSNYVMTPPPVTTPFQRYFSNILLRSNNTINC